MFSLSSLSPKKLEMLKSSQSIPRMYIMLSSYEIDTQENAVFYLIEVGVEKGSDIEIHRVRRRYSAIKEFDDQIRVEYSDSRFLMPFPPKKFFGNMEKEFITKRYNELSVYLSNLVKIPRLTKAFEFLKFFEISTAEL